MDVIQLLKKEFVAEDYFGMILILQHFKIYVFLKSGKII